MRNYLLLCVLVMVAGLLWFQRVQADVAPSLRPNLQRARGGGLVSGTGESIYSLASGSAELITGVTVSCGASPCVAGLYDAVSAATAGVGNLTNANVVFEVPAAANTGAYVNLKDAPIRTRNGVMVVNSGTGNATVVYTEQST